MDLGIFKLNRTIIVLNYCAVTVLPKSLCEVSTFIKKCGIRTKLVDIVLDQHFLNTCKQQSYEFTAYKMFSFKSGSFEPARLLYAECNGNLPELVLYPPVLEY